MKLWGEWGVGLWNTACTKTIGFLIVLTPGCGKNVLVERSKHVNQMLDDPLYISQGTVYFAYESKNKSLRNCRYCKLTWTKVVVGVRINTAIQIYNQNFKPSSLFATQVFYNQLCGEVWNARCDCFLFDIQRHVFFVCCIWRSQFWGLLSDEVTDDRRRSLRLACISHISCESKEQIETSTTKQVQLWWIFPYHKTRLNKTLDSTMCRPISEQSSANVVPPRFLRPEGLL